MEVTILQDQHKGIEKIQVHHVYNIKSCIYSVGIHFSLKSFFKIQHILHYGDEYSFLRNKMVFTNLLNKPFVICFSFQWYRIHPSWIHRGVSKIQGFVLGHIP